MVTPEIVGHIDPAGLPGSETNGRAGYRELDRLAVDFRLVRSMTTTNQGTLLHS
jgi:hypothetical protein